MSVPLKRHPFSVAEYHRMAETGILTEDDRVELIEGEIIEMSPKGSRHSGCINALTELCGEKARGEAHVSVQNPIRLDDFSEPEPDLALLKRREDHYRRATPTPDGVLLVIEVSDTTATYERGVKIPLYARSGIREAWIVDLTREKVEVYARPEHGGYKQFREAGRGEAVAPQGVPSLALAVDDILG
jgi:Uma2 family endonuclease